MVMTATFEGLRMLIHEVVFALSYGPITSFAS
jgi:hypothetical protein